MPRYSYLCTACAYKFEQQQSLIEPALTECPKCGGELRKEFGVGGITFKGSGFYRTDSSKSAGTGSSGSEKSSSSDS